MRKARVRDYETSEDLAWDITIGNTNIIPMHYNDWWVLD